jgi:hypothetical protein
MCLVSLGLGFVAGVAVTVVTGIVVSIGAISVVREKARRD